MSASLQRAISIAGSQEALGNAIGVSQGRVSQWLAGELIPVRYWPRIQAATDKQVTVHELLEDELAKLSSAETSTAEAV